MVPLWTGEARLEATSDAVLLVDVPESRTLLAVLEQGCDGHDHGHVDAHHAEHSSEDVVDEDVGERGQGGGAALEQCRRGRARAGGVRDEGRSRAVKVAAALELVEGSAHLRTPIHSILRTVVWRRSWTLAGWVVQISKKVCFVLRVMIHRSRPMIRVKIASATTRYPANFNHPRAGVTIAGRVRRKMNKVKAALAIPAYELLAGPARHHPHRRRTTYLSTEISGTEDLERPHHHPSGGRSMSAAQ